MSPIPSPWRLLAVLPVLVITVVIGAAGIFEADRAQAALVIIWSG